MWVRNEKERCENEKIAKVAGKTCNNVKKWKNIHNVKLYRIQFKKTKVKMKEYNRQMKEIEDRPEKQKKSNEWEEYKEIVKEILGSHKERAREWKCVKGHERIWAGVEQNENATTKERRCEALQCSTMKSKAIQCNAAQWKAMQCNAIQRAIRTVTSVPNRNTCYRKVIQDC